MGSLSAGRGIGATLWMGTCDGHLGQPPAQPGAGEEEWKGRWRCSVSGRLVSECFSLSLHFENGFSQAATGDQTLLHPRL